MLVNVSTLSWDAGEDEGEGEDEGDQIVLAFLSTAIALPYDCHFAHIKKGGNCRNNEKQHPLPIYF